MRHQFLTTILFASLPTGAPALLQAQELDNVLFTVGTSVEDTDGDGETPVFLLWQSADLQQLQGREFAIYSKPGAADSPDPYLFEGTARLRLDPAAIKVLINRGDALGDDSALLESDINNLFEELVPAGDIPLEEKISAVVAGCLGDPELFENLLFLSRKHATLSLVIGTGFTAAYPDGEVRTFEVRECPPDAGTVDQCDEVRARITLEVGVPEPLPAPGRPVYVPFTDDKGDPDPRAHLNVPLRWATPDALRGRSLLQFGYNLYRMTAQDAGDLGYDVNPPDPETLAILAEDAGHSTTRVNEPPILIDNPLTEAEAADLTSDPETYWIIDDNGRYRPGGAPFANGEEYYYFVTARDILGRDGEVSQGTPVLICDFQPPPQPKNLRVTNHYSFNPVTDINTQHFMVEWDAPDVSATATPESISAYQVYRWWTIEEMQQKQAFPGQGATTTAGGLVAVLPASETAFIDDGPTAPFLQVERLSDGSTIVDQNYANKTFWYTVRAVDESACGGNLSGNSAPAYGVLRDRIGPPKPGGVVRLDCLDIRVVAPREVQSAVPFEDPPELGIAYLTFEGRRLDNYVEWVEFATYDPVTGERTLQGERYYFAESETSRTIQFKVPQPTQEAPLRAACRMGGRNGTVSVWNELDIPIISNEFSAFYILWEGESRIRKVLPGRDCDTHVSLNPDLTVNGVELEFDLTPGTEEWKVYRRVNDGQQTLVAQGLDSATEVLFVIVEDLNMPARDARICYFVQVFDQHGNPSPIVRLGCVEVQGKEELPAPMLAAPLSLGDEAAPQALLNWFCPPYGIEYFEVWVSSESGELPALLGADFDPPGADSTADGRTWRPFRSKRVPVTFPSNTPEFGTQIDGIELGETYTFRIRAVGEAGGFGPFSNEEEFTWNPDSSGAVSGPDVPWPALGLPPVSQTFNEGILARTAPFGFDGAGVRIARLNYTNLDNPANFENPSDFFFPPLVTDPNDVVYKNDAGESLFPFVLYRYQVANARYPATALSGDVYQVSPMMESIAVRLEPNPALGINTYQNYDPFVFLIPESGETSSSHYDLMFKDTQPVVSGARYRYLIVRFDPDTREIVQVIPTNAVDIP
ncbi:MAG: hypothetical protein ACP5I4_11465 [Oceanipulchritudo sp.]